MVLLLLQISSQDKMTGPICSEDLESTKIRFVREALPTDFAEE